MPIIPRYSQGKCEERRGLDYIGTEHILLALVRDRESVAARVPVTDGAGLDHIGRIADELVQRYPAR
ncbi:Clp protease N-terminal domain-containing protein [Microbispora sp. NBRC 16548]|uniref:Clp protease N-terminal domain-containing protein n=1 Tax=Microbispora sp. NBRC 16548 TaxID=3030994 RepID=UPI001615C3B0